MTSGKTCEKCSGGREYWCVLRNCEKSLFRNVGYALRNYVARRKRFYIDNVTLYAALTQFQRQRLIQEGYPADRIYVVPNMADVNETKVSVELGNYVSYIGRVSPEKGISTFMEAARLCRNIQFKIAGLNVRMPDVSREALSNLEFCGYLKANQLGKFYCKSRIIILPSICYETFGLTLAEAALWGKPVICSRIGGLPEIVEDGVTGLLFQPGNAHDLQAKVRYLWERPELCERMGQAGREKALCEFSAHKYYKNLMAIYEKAMQLVQEHYRQNIVFSTNLEQC
jgi:glycosyltransferase involved in cell wall biosynthesis